MKRDACSFVSSAGPHAGKRLIINDTLKLTENTIFVNDQARDEAGNPVFGAKDNSASRNRKLRYFQGWVWIKHAGPTAAPEDRKASFSRGVFLHTEGRRVPVMYEDGSESPYLLELALLTYQNTKLPILKFTLIDKATNKSVVYTWANTDASLVGMNLGWFQAGFTQKTERVNFGF
jgi:hypothetical protein